MGNPLQELAASGFDELVHCDDKYFLKKGLDTAGKLC